MKIDLTNKNALVGASSQGIGLAIATELAHCGACFLASDYASYITGTNIPIDGGLSRAN